jgi:hypothetical protein
MEICEDRDLRPQDSGLERLLHEVDGAGLVRSQDTRSIRIDRRDEDDRRAASVLSGAVPHLLCGLDAVHRGHLEVEEDDRELSSLDLVEGVLARGHADELVVL